MCVTFLKIKWATSTASTVLGLIVIGPSALPVQTHVMELREAQHTHTHTHHTHFFRSVSVDWMSDYKYPALSSLLSSPYIKGCMMSHVKASRGPAAAGQGGDGERHHRVRSSYTDNSHCLIKKTEKWNLVAMETPAVGQLAHNPGLAWCLSPLLFFVCSAASPVDCHCRPDETSTCDNIHRGVNKLSQSSWPIFVLTWCF